jgi:hypothetical protein
VLALAAGSSAADAAALDGGRAPVLPQLGAA